MKYYIREMRARDSRCIGSAGVSVRDAPTINALDVEPTSVPDIIKPSSSHICNMRRRQHPQIYTRNTRMLQHLDTTRGAAIPLAWCSKTSYSPSTFPAHRPSYSSIVAAGPLPIAAHRKRPSDSDHARGAPTLHTYPSSMCGALIQRVSRLNTSRRKRKKRCATFCVSLVYTTQHIAAKGGGSLGGLMRAPLVYIVISFSMRCEACISVADGIKESSNFCVVSLASPDFPILCLTEA